jgi:hypothetical protein
MRLFDRCVHGDDRGAGRRRSFARGLDGKRIASPKFGLRSVLVGRRVQLLQLAACRFLRNLRVAYCAAYLDREQAKLLFLEYEEIIAMLFAMAKNPDKWVLKKIENSGGK